MIFEIFFLFLFIAILMQKPLYRFCAQQLTRGISGSMSSGATSILAAATTTTTSSSPKNILNNNSSSASITEATHHHQSTQLSTSVDENVVRELEADDTAVIDKKMSMVEVVGSNGETHVNSNNNNNSNINNNNNTMKGTTTNGHNMQNGDIATNGADTVDKAAAAMHLTDDKSELFKLNEGGDGNNKTTTTTTNSNIKSKEAEITSNGINANGTSLLAVPATDDACDLSRSDSRTSCDSMPNNNNNNNDDSGEHNALEGIIPEDITATSTTSTATLVNGDTLKKKLRLSSGRQITKKAKRVRFFRNGDKFYSGLVIPVSNERYRSFESLTEDLTRVLGESIKVPGAVRTIFTVDGKKVSTLEDLEDGKCYVCSCNNEVFKRIEYSSQQNNKLNNRLSR